MYKINLDNGKHSFWCQKGEDVLRASKKNFAKIPNGCCSGGCGMCKIKVIQGKFTLGTSSFNVLSEDERKLNYSLACKTYPHEDLEISILTENKV